MASEIEIQEIFKKEKEIYDKEKEDFYSNPLHWSNNKRRLNGLPVLRGEINKHRRKKFKSYRPSQAVWIMLENMITDAICKNFIDDCIDYDDYTFSKDE